VQLSKSVNTLKAVSSRLIKNKYEKNFKKDIIVILLFYLKAIALYLLVVLLSKRLKNVLKIKENSNFKFNI